MKSPGKQCKLVVGRTEVYDGHVGFCVLKPGEKPTKAQKVVAVLSKYCQEGMEMNRDDVLESISDLNQDLLELEGGVEIATCTGDDSNGTTTPLMVNVEIAGTNVKTRI